MKSPVGEPARGFSCRPDDEDAAVNVFLMKREALPVGRKRRRRLLSVCITGDQDRIAAADALQVDVP